MTKSLLRHNNIVTGAPEEMCLEVTAEDWQ